MTIVIYVHVYICIGSNNPVTIIVYMDLANQDKQTPFDIPWLYGMSCY